MNFANIELEKNENIAIMLIHRPQVLNALDTPTLKELETIFGDLEADETVRVIIITGSGNKAFSAGADLKENERLREEQLLERVKLGQRVFNQIENLGKPVIAAINGYALGGGLELAMACDLRVATPESKLGLPEITLGGIPGWGGTQRLPRLVGKTIAMELILTGKMIDALEARDLGLVNSVVEADVLLEETKTLARKIANKAPQALKCAKWAIHKSGEVSLQVGLDYEVLYSNLLFATKDNREGTRAFLEKRRPHFKGQ